MERRIWRKSLCGHTNFVLRLLRSWLLARACPRHDDDDDNDGDHYHHDHGIGDNNNYHEEVDHDEW